MKKHRRILTCILIALCFCFLFASPAFAVTEDEVQQQVDSVGKEAVSGNIFVWFLCAIAFLKASQKIDSFMSSLGINVGHTGGSMMAEAMLATRGVSAIKGGIGGVASHFTGGRGGGGSGGGSAGDGAGGFMAGGLAGAVGRHFSQSAASSVTGQGGGLASGISRKMFNSSLAKGGEFANQVIGSVAKGRVAAAGTISGATAAAAMNSYFGGGRGGAGGFSDTSGPEGGPSGAESSGSVPSGGGYSDGADGMDGPDMNPDGGSYVPGSGSSTGGEAADFSDGTVPDADSIPMYSDVEIGGGHITGRETSVSEPGGIDFAMYSVDQYSKPQGDHSVVQAADGSKWYKQYAVDTVDKTPYMDEEGEIKFHEKLIKAVPRPPMRKDRQ